MQFHIHALLLALTAAGVLHAAEPAAPFPDALDAAAIVVDRLDNILEHSLILGNGDVNALLYAKDGNVMLRLTKNDVWDARLDTSEDPPLLPIKRIKELAQGDWPRGGRFTGGWLGPDGAPHRGGNSWSRPYPCPRPCADVRLGVRPSQPTWRKVRSAGKQDAWLPGDGGAVMSVTGRKGASNGYAYHPLDLSTDEYNRIRLKLSGTPNAQFYVDVLDPAGGVIFGSKWKPTPAKSGEFTFALPPGKRAGRLILYTWTNDGRRAENRFESVAFEGPKGKMPIDLGAAATAAVARAARLDIRRGVAHVPAAKSDGRATTVRALADRNVFLIDSPAMAALVPFKSSYPLPPVKRGERDGVRWLQQDLPGDLDWPGMSYVVALAAKGDRKTVAIVTSLESKDPLADAVTLARETLDADGDKLVERHEAVWRRFWAKSGVDLDDTFLRDVWYRNLYFMRCVAAPGAACVGLYAGLVNDRPAWHGSHTTNYNAEQTFWTPFPTNHPELTDPYVDLITEYLPRARWLCRQLYDCEGAYFPHNIFCHEPPEPTKCRSRLGRQQFYVSWSYTIGVSGFTVQNLWWRYKYQPDRAYLAKFAYPAVRDVAVFYANFIDQCERADDGKVILAPSVSPEHWGWTRKFLRNRNCTFDIAMVRYTLRAAIEGATTLGTDVKLVERFRRAEGLLPDYPTTGGDEPVVVDVQDAPPITYNIAVPATPVFPGDVVTWFSPAAEKELFARSIARCKWNGNNSAIILSVARARLSMPGTLEWMRGELKARSRPNGTLTLNRLGHGINNNGHYTEQFAASMAVSELLLQSVGDVIRLFPAWPTDKAARFRDLRAQGGFLVSAHIADARIGPVSITSTAGGTLRLLSPWPAPTVRRGDNGPITKLRPDARGIIELNTRPAERLLLQAGR